MHKHINQKYPELADATEQLCVDLLTGQQTATLDQRVGDPGACAADPIACANRTTMYDVAVQQATRFPDATFMRHLTRDERSVALERGVPCHIEHFTSAHMIESTWWYCDSEGNYMIGYTFRNGKLHSTYTP